MYQLLAGCFVCVLTCSYSADPVSGGRGGRGRGRGGRGAGWVNNDQGEFSMFCMSL